MNVTNRIGYLSLLLLALGSACSGSTGSPAPPDDEQLAPNEQEADPGTGPEDDEQEDEALEPEGCIEISGSVREPLVLKKRQVPPGSPDYCIDVPYTPLHVFAPITVEPGVIIEMARSAAVEIRDGGSLYAVGTEEAPILFTGRHKAPGSWDGLFFESPSPDNVLEHVIVEYAGGDATFDRGTITLGTYTGDDGYLALSHTVLRYGAAAGIVAYTGRFTKFSNNTITEHAGPPALGYLTILAALDSSSRFSGNNKDWVEVISSSTSADIVLSKLDVPIASRRSSTSEDVSRSPPEPPCCSRRTRES